MAKGLGDTGAAGAALEPVTVVVTGQDVTFDILLPVEDQTKPDDDEDE